MNLESAIERLNAIGESVFEYETQHRDAGDNYSHMPCESWTSYDDSRLADYMQERGIKFDGLEIDVISSEVLEYFRMESNHAFATGDGSFLVASYPVGEIETEIQAESLGLDKFTPEICESLSRGSDVYLRYDSQDRAFGYIGAEYNIWDAIISEKALRGIVKSLRDES